MKTFWGRVTLMRYCRPGDDYELTPLRIAAGLAFCAALLLGPTAFARLLS